MRARNECALNDGNMKAVLFTACGWAILGSVGATCDEPSCKKYCNGAFCAQNCTGATCGSHCIGNSCAKGCNGDLCGAGCKGKNCAAGCQDDFCDFRCYHFEGEKCTDKLDTETITMGIECGADGEYFMHCEHKNHPALWQALKDTETNDDPIRVLPEDIQQCFYNGADCVDTVDGLPPLVCNNFQNCIFIDGTIKVDAKCTDADQCGRCTGICEKDSECKGGLKCYKRTGNETVPGCSSSISALYQGVQVLNVPGKGYCADIPDSSTLNDGEIAAIVIGALLLSAAVGALVWCYRTKQGFFDSSSSMAEPIKF